MSKSNLRIFENTFFGSTNWKNVEISPLKSIGIVEKHNEN